MTRSALIPAKTSRTPKQVGKIAHARRLGGETVVPQPDQQEETTILPKLTRKPLSPSRWGRPLSPQQHSARRRRRRRPRQSLGRRIVDPRPRADRLPPGLKVWAPVGAAPTTSSARTTKGGQQAPISMARPTAVSITLVMRGVWPPRTWSVSNARGLTLHLRYRPPGSAWAG